MKHLSHLFIFTCAFVIYLTSTTAKADTLRGQIRDELTHVPIEGATVELRLTPESPTPDLELESDPFGFFETTNVAASTAYSLTVKHPAYTTESEVVVVDTPRKSQNFELTPLAAGTIFDVYVQVSDTTTYLELKNISVVMRQYNGPTGGSPIRTETVTTNINGTAFIRGLTAGFFEFEANPAGGGNLAGWESAPATTRSLLNQPHALNVLLKPVPQSLTFKIQGYDYEKNSPDPFFPNGVPEPLKDMVVELTALDPADTDVTLMPPMNEVTKEDGQVTFPMLPGVAYEAKVKALGYFTKKVIIQPDNQGLLPTEVQVLDVQAEPHEVVLQYNYEGYLPNQCQTVFSGFHLPDPNRFNGLSMPGLEVILQGIEGSTTEGVVRHGIHEFNINTCRSSTYFLEGYLKPGRYKVTFRGVIEGPLAWEDSFGYRNANEASFPVLQEEYIEIKTRGPEPQVVTPATIYTTTQEITLKINRERVRGRLWEAETAQAPGEDIGRFEVPKPLYKPMPNQQLIFHQPANLDIFGDFTPVTVTTDEDGFYELFLKPGIYAVEAPGLNGHYGERFVYEVRSEAGGRQIGSRIAGAWPEFEAWPASRDDFPNYPGAGGGHGLAINGGDDPVVNLYLLKERYYLNLSVSTSGPTASQAIFTDMVNGNYEAPYHHLAATSGTANILKSTGGSLNAPILVDRTVGLNMGAGVSDFSVFALFKDLPPDSYSFNLSDPDHDFIHPELLQDVVLMDYPPPGRAPSIELLQAVEAQGLNNTIPLGVAYRQIEAEEKSVPINITAFQWEQKTFGSDEFEYKPTLAANLGFFEAQAYAPGLFILPFNKKVPANGADIYVTPQFDGTTICKVANGGTVYFGGPSATPTVSYPQTIYDVELIAKPAGGYHAKAAGAKLVIGGTPVVTTSSPLTVSGLMEALTVEDDLTDDFILADSSWFVETTGARPKVQVTVLIESAVTIKATVTNSVTGDPIKDSMVRILDFLGNPLSDRRTAANGLANFSGQKLRTYFIELDQPGYFPFRKRLAVEDLQELSGVLTHLVPITLVPLTGPAFVAGTESINRSGGFLPGVTRSGDQSAFELYSASDVLTATWTVDITPGQFNIDLPGFDQMNGDLATESDQLQVTDLLDEVYLVDQREFEKTGLQGMSTPLAIPSVLSPHLVQSFIRDILRGKKNPADPAASKTYLGKAELIEPGATAGQYKVTGKIPLWELPAGDFKPALIAISRRGGVGAILFDASPNDPTRLTGVAIPKWLGSVFDILGVTAGVSATQDQINEYVPIGKFIPIPEFTAQIAEAKNEGGMKTGFIDYTYEVSTGVEVGQKTPARGLASLAPGLIGAQLSTTAKISSTGEERALKLVMESTVTKEKINATKSKYIPSIVQKLGADVTISKVGGGVRTTFISNSDVTKPYNLRLLSEIGGNVDLNAKMNLTAVTGKIPYAGPILILLDKTGFLKTTATTTAGIGFTDNHCWETLRPQDLTFNSTEDPDPRTRRRHYLGGNELGAESGIDDCTIERSICMRFGVGMQAEASALGFALGADVGLELAGPDCGIPAAPSLTLTFNTFGDYPVIKRIQGEVNLNLRGYIQTPISKQEKKYKWNLLKVDAQYGTETVVQLVPMEVLYTEITPANFATNQFTGNGPHLVTNSSSILQDSVDVMGDLFLATLYNSVTGKVELRLSSRDGNLSWGGGTLVTEADVIGSNAVHKLPDGRIVVAWAEPVFGVDPNDILSSQYVRYSVSDVNGENFSAPQTALFLSGPAGSIHLSQSADNLVLLTQMIVGTTQDTTHQFFGQTFNGTTNSFNTAVFLGQETSGVQGLKLLGAGSAGAGDVTLVFLNSLGQLKNLRWDGSTLVPLTTIAEGLNAGLAGYANGAGYKVLAVTSDGLLKSFSAGAGTGSSFDQGVDVASGINPLEAEALPQSVTVDGGLIYVFTEGITGGTKIRYLHIDSLNQPALSGLQELTDNKRGTYTHLRLSRLSADEIYVHALFENVTSEERAFSISVTNGLSGNNSDDDSLLDTKELRIVDANPNDMIKTVTDVLANADFDMDDYDNGVEIMMGTDPTDPFDFPEATDPGTEPGMLAFGAPLISVQEDVGTAQIPVFRTGGSAGAISVTVNSTFGSATAADFTPVSDLGLDFADGETQKFVEVDIVSDSTLKEANETFTLTLNNTTGGSTLGTQSTTTVRIIDAFDKGKPTLSLLTPKKNAVIVEADGNSVQVTGLAKDKQGIETVEISIDGGPFQPATLTHANDLKSATFTQELVVTPGPHTLLARAVDTIGLLSNTAKITFSYRVERPLAVTLNGNGSVSKGFTPTSTRLVGTSYSIKASPQKDFVFDGWTANDFTGTGVTMEAAELPQLQFIMQENLALTANFMTNPFTNDISGSYNGLVRPNDTTSPNVNNTGLFSAQITNKGAFSGSLLIDGAKISIKGIFTNQGYARFGKTNSSVLTILRKGKPNLDIELTLDMTGDTGQLTGTVAQGSESVSEISADRAHYSRKNLVDASIAGTKGQRYNLILPTKVQTPPLALNLYPQGTGFGSMIVKPDGKVAFSMLLADKTKLTASTALSRNDEGPLFAQLYAKKGSLAGLVTIDPSLDETDVIGIDYLWFRPALPKLQWYPVGWPDGLNLDLLGSKFEVPSSESVFLGLGPEDDLNGNAQLSFTGGLLSEPLDKTVNITPINKVINAPPTDKSFTIKLTKTTGQLKGTFTDEHGKKTAWEALIFQKPGTQQGGHGFFLTAPAKPLDGLGESGEATLMAK